MYDTFACYDAAEIVAPVVPDADRLNINFNRKDINVGYVIKLLLPFIDKRDWAEFVKFTPELTRKCISSKNLFDGMNSRDRVAIFHWNFDNASHTVQFAVDSCGKYHVDEIKERYNRKCYLPAMGRIGEILSRINSPI